MYVYIRCAVTVISTNVIHAYSSFSVRTFFPSHIFPHEILVSIKCFSQQMKITFSKCIAGYMYVMKHRIELNTNKVLFREKERESRGKRSYFKFMFYSHSSHIVSTTTRHITTFSSSVLSTCNHFTHGSWNKE